VSYIIYLLCSKRHGEGHAADERHEVECYKYILNIFSIWYSSQVSVYMCEYSVVFVTV